MITTTISEFRKNSKKLLTNVCENFEPLILHRGKEEDVVIISALEYSSLMATNHELSSRKNEARLDAAITSFNQGEGVTQELIETL